MSACREIWQETAALSFEKSLQIKQVIMLYRFPPCLLSFRNSSTRKFPFILHVSLKLFIDYIMWAKCKILH